MSRTPFLEPLLCFITQMHHFPPDVEYSESGEGPALLLLPGSFGTGSGWKAVTDRLSQSYRIITTSLLGYGATAERRPLGNASMSQQTEVIDRIIDRIGAPTHIVGHSFGGLAALAHAVDGSIKPASLMLIEANPLGLLKTAGEAECYAMFGRMTAQYFAAFEAGDTEAARHVIDFYGGQGTFDAFPPKVRDYVVKTTPSNIRDWSSGTPFEPPLTAYNQIEAPTLVVRGGAGHPAMFRLAELLAEVIPNARLETVAGGTHFLPATNPRELASMLEAHVTSTTALR
ncbi:MAG: alpha/beta hydrolase [Steroidobacteraceae bacterium]